MRISDWSSDVCSSDLHGLALPRLFPARLGKGTVAGKEAFEHGGNEVGDFRLLTIGPGIDRGVVGERVGEIGHHRDGNLDRRRSEEHTSELQSLMRISYAGFCLKKKNKKEKNTSLD